MYEGIRLIFTCLAAGVPLLQLYVDHRLVAVLVYQVNQPMEMRLILDGTVQDDKGLRVI